MNYEDKAAYTKCDEQSTVHIQYFLIGVGWTKLTFCDLHGAYIIRDWDLQGLIYVRFQP